MPGKRAASKGLYRAWLDRDLVRRWLGAHDPKTNPANVHLAKLLEEELARMEAAEEERRSDHAEGVRGPAAR